MRANRVVLDSSVWIEILGSGRFKKQCERELGLAGEILIPTMVVFEVYRKIVSVTSEDVDTCSCNGCRCDTGYA